MANNIRYALGSKTFCRDRDGAGERRSAAIDGSGAGPATLLDYRLTQAENEGVGSVRLHDLHAVRFYRHRMVQSGDVIEVYDYESTQYTKHGLPKAMSSQPRKMTKEEKAKKRKENVHRARKGLIRTINANVNEHGGERPKFVTMTYDDDHLLFGVKQGNYAFKKFIQRLEYLVVKMRGCEKDYKVQYTTITRFQDGHRPGGKMGGRGGAIHHHVVFYNLPYIAQKKLMEVWDQGFVWINAIDDVDNLGVYVVEGYMGKEMDDERLNGQKRYWSSRGLLKPREGVSMHPFENTELDDDHLAITAMYSNEYVGTVTYRQYNLRRIGGVYERKKKKRRACGRIEARQG